MLLYGLTSPKASHTRLQLAGGFTSMMPGGSKLWRWKYRLDGKENRCALGSYPDLPLKEARELTEAARKLVKKGIHPAQQKKIDRVKSVHEQANTFEAIAKEWLALKDWEEVTKKRRLDMLARVIFPTIGHLPVKDILPPVILNILKKAAEKKWHFRDGGSQANPVRHI